MALSLVKIIINISIKIKGLIKTLTIIINIAILKK